ncbi:MAG TPA: AAA family ATPase [Clostridiales bacterium]|nr:AAA family ATPase [Clostridiales bacterium]HQP70964.1 AAA family ATPase [Clostridiales bacterium]
MIKRSILDELEKWSKKKNRKPLILRGARQVGKTTAVEMFAKKFDQFIHLNLDKKSDLALFENNDFNKLLDSIFYVNGMNKDKKNTLVFIDEIQNSPKAVAYLRYFYENTPDLYVISAGSLLETVLNVKISFPVGRCEYLKMHPVTFREYLEALKETQSIELIDNCEFPDYAHEKLTDLFCDYTLTGGMPEAVKVYIETKDRIEVNRVYESLIVSYLEDIEKYSDNLNFSRVISHTLKFAFKTAGERISFEGFGNANYKSREIGEALRLLEKAMLIKLAYPSTDINYPFEENHRRKPRLHIVDTGLLNYFSGIQQEMFLSRNITDGRLGRIYEHITGQELMAKSFSPLHNVSFWIREKNQSNAELDYLYQYNGKAYPIEVKSGKTGTLKSLHQFIDETGITEAIRLYSGKFSIETASTIKGNKFRLMNLPFYALPSLEKLIEREFIKQSK